MNATEKITQLFRRHFSYISANPSLASVIFSEEIFKNEPVLIASIKDVIGYNQKLLTEMIVDGQAKNQLRNDLPADHLALVLMGTLRLFVKKWQLQNSAFNLEEEGNSLIESIKLLITKI